MSLVERIDAATFRRLDEDRALFVVIDAVGKYLAVSKEGTCFNIVEDLAAAQKFLISATENSIENRRVERGLVCEGTDAILLVAREAQREGEALLFNLFEYDPKIYDPRCPFRLLSFLLSNNRALFATGDGSSWQFEKNDATEDDNSLTLKLMVSLAKVGTAEAEDQNSRRSSRKRVQVKCFWNHHVS